MLNTFVELSQEFTERESGSPAATKAAQAIAAQTSALNLKTVTEKIKVLSFQNSLLSFELGSIAAIIIGLYLPQLGLVLQAILWLLLLGEIKRPILAKVKSGEAENIVVTIPARSKETQRVVLTAGYDTSVFMPTPFGLKPQLYWGLNIGFALAVPTLQLIGIVLKLHWLTLGSLLPLLVILGFYVLPKQTSNDLSGLNGCNALLETASILLRFRPSITTVIIYFTGAHSLNSGVQILPAVFKNENPTYGLNLVEQNREQIGIVSQEGFLPRPGSSLLKEILTEVAETKSIPIESITTSDITPSYPLLAKKMNAISLAVPAKDTDQNLRELLVGFIRKIEH